MLTSYDFSFWDWGNSIYFSKATNNIIKILNLKLDSSQTKPVHLQLAVTSRRSLGSFLTQDWEPVTITLQALELIDKAEPVQVHFTLNLRDQQSMSMQDGCRVYMATRGLCFMVSWTIFKNHLLKAGLTQNMETMHGIPNTHNYCFYSIFLGVRTHMKRILLFSIWLMANHQGCLLCRDGG